MDNDIVKRLVWSGLLAGVGALASVVTARVAAVVYRQLFDEDPPRVSTSSAPTTPKPLLPTGGVAALERPEGQVGLAFAGGLLAALILKRLVG